MTGKPLRVLLVEDSEADALLIVRELNRGGYAPTYERVETPDAMDLSLKRQGWDVVISDYSMPHFSGLGALTLLQEKKHDLPFIIISGKSGEDTAVAVMKAGAHDYIMKDNLTRLVPAIERETREALVRRERARGEGRIRKLSGAIEQSQSLVMITDPDGAIEYVNPGFIGVTGFSAQECRGRGIVEMRLCKKDDPIRGEVWETLSSGRIWEGELKSLKKNGECFFEYATFSPVRDPEGELTGYVKISEDITARKRAEEQRHSLQARLFKAEKMEAIGTLAAGVAHDFNNLLTTIRGNAELAMDKTEVEDPVSNRLEEIVLAVESAARVTRQLLVFSRRQPMELEPSEINATIEKLLKTLKRVMGEEISVTTNLDPSLWMARADQGSLEQVMMNLTVNARDAMAEGGSLNIRTENVTVDEDFCELNPDARTGRFVCITVEDTGAGMDGKVLEHIFEPFFSTKDFDGGTGLGLAVVYGIVKEHRGWINVTSKPGEGSTFRVYLPAVFLKSKRGKRPASAPKGAKAPTPAHIPTHIPVKVLLVEDEPGVRGFAEAALKNAGFEVRAAPDSRGAIKIFEEAGGDFQLVFSDVILPDKNGLVLAEELLRKSPSLGVVLASGYTDSRSNWERIKEKGFTFIQKPYSTEELLRAIAGVTNVKNESNVRKESRIKDKNKARR